MQSAIDLYREEYDREGSEKVLDIINGLVFGSIGFFDCSAKQSSCHHPNKSQFEQESSR